MYEYEMFKARELELHSRAAAERLVREAIAAGRPGERAGLVERVVRVVRREAAPRAESATGKARSGAAAGCAG